MLCPVCKTDMFVLEFELIEIDHCPVCGGVWLDSGELELMGERAGALRGDLFAALGRQKGVKPGGRPKRRCPVCRRGLLEVRTPGERPIVIDRCPREHGLWFDRGELKAVIHAAGAEEGNVLARFLSDLESDNVADRAQGSDSP